MGSTLRAARAGPACTSGARARRNALSGRRELLIVIGAWLVYFGIRALSEGRASTARAHARDLLALEHRLGIAWERAGQRPIADHHWLLTAANWVYVWGHWPVIALTALWLFHRHPPAYRELRLAFLVSGAIGVVIFALYPWRRRGSRSSATSTA